MTLLQRIKDDQLQARKDRNQNKTSALTTLYSEAANIGLNDHKRESTDLEVIAVVKKFIKSINELIAVVDEETAISYIHEREIYEAYIPKQLTEDEIIVIAKQVISTIAEPSIRSLGIVMNELNRKHAGLFDGRQASAVIRSLLA